MAEFVYGDYETHVRVRAWSGEDTPDGCPIVEIGTRGTVTSYAGTAAGMRFALDDVDTLISELLKARAEIAKLMRKAEG